MAITIQLGNICERESGMDLVIIKWLRHATNPEFSTQHATPSNPTLVNNWLVREPSTISQKHHEIGWTLAHLVLL